MIERSGPADVRAAPDAMEAKEERAPHVPDPPDPLDYKRTDMADGPFPLDPLEGKSQRRRYKLAGRSALSLPGLRFPFARPGFASLGVTS